LTDWTVSWVSISWAVTVVSARFSDFTDSSLRVASSDVSRTARASDYSVDASSSAKIARVDGARIAVITILCNAGALSGAIASSSSTSIRSNAFWSVNAAGRWVEGISGTCITIITAWNNNFAFVGCWVTLVGCTSNRLASDCIVNTSSGRIAVGGGTCRSSWASNWSGDDTINCIASVGDTLSWWFLCNQLSRDVGEDTLSSASAATVNGTDALIITDFADVQANSTCKIARISGTCIVVIAVNWSVNTVS